MGRDVLGARTSVGRGAYTALLAHSSHLYDSLKTRKAVRAAASHAGVQSDKRRKLVKGILPNLLRRPPLPAPPVQGGSETRGVCERVG